MDKEIKCKYCGKAVPEKAKVTREIISRTYPGGRKTFAYCSKDCGAYDQMAHEG